MALLLAGGPPQPFRPRYPVRTDHGKAENTRPVVRKLVFSLLLAAKGGLELAVFTAHQKTYQNSKDEPDEQGKSDFWHDISFDLGYILYRNDT